MKYIKKFVEDIRLSAPAEGKVVAAWARGDFDDTFIGIGENVAQAVRCLVRSTERTLNVKVTLVEGPSTLFRR